MNYQFAQTFSVNNRIKEFRNKKYQAAHEEMKQLHTQAALFSSQFWSKHLHPLKKEEQQKVSYFYLKKMEGLKQEHAPMKAPRANIQIKTKQQV